MDFEQQHKVSTYFFAAVAVCGFGSILVYTLVDYVIQLWRQQAHGTRLLAFMAFLYYLGCFGLLFLS